MRRGTERKIVAIQFKAAGRVVGKPEVTENLAFDSFEHPGHPSVPAIRHAPKRLGGIKPFRNKADAGQLLRRSAKILPEATLLPVRGEIVLAWPRLPCTHPGIELTHLHAPRLVVAITDIPIEAVAPKIDQPSAIGDIVLRSIEDRLGKHIQDACR